MYFSSNFQAQASHQVVVIIVRRSARFPRVVGNRCAFLFAVDRLDRGVGVEYPRNIKQGRDAFIDLLIQPGDARFAWYRLQRPALGVFGNDAVHPQKSRINTIASDGGHVRVAFMA